jgi:hypothetical protein
LDKSRHCKQSGYNSLDLFLSIYQTFYSFLAIKPLGGFKALKSFSNDLILLKNAGAFAGRIGNVSLLEEYMLKILEINSSDVVHYNCLFKRTPRLLCASILFELDSKTT